MKQLQIYFGGVKVLNKKTGQTEIIEDCIYKENATPKDKRIIKHSLWKMNVSHRHFDTYEIVEFLFDTAKKVGKTVYHV